MPYEIIRRAIADKASVTGEYESYIQLFSPHALGRDAGGDATVVAFQYGGGTPAGLPVGGAWRSYLVPRLRQVRRNNDKWVAGPLGGKPLHVLKTIDIAVQE